MINDFTHVIYPSLVGLFVIVGSIQLVYRHKTVLNYMLFGMYLSLGYFIFYLWKLNTDSLPEFLFSTELIVPFLVGPYICYYFLIISGANKNKRKYALYPVIIFSILTGAVILLNIFGSKPQISSNMVYFDNSIVHYLLDTSGDGVFVFFALYMFLKLLKYGIPFKRKNAFLKIIFLFSIFFLIATGSMALTHFIDSGIPVFISVFFHSLFAISFLYFSYRYPKETQFVLTDAAPKQYHENESTPPWAPEAESRLHNLFEHEFLYRDPDLSLSTVAAKLGITDNQLSWLINRRFGLNFRSFVNNCRLSEAKKLLHDRSHMNILEIAFYTGFNSKSSFNTLFKEKFQLTPREFRKLKETD